MVLSRLATYRIPSSCNLVLARGSVVDFSHATRGAIVNAANEGCLGGGGVDGAISDAGGPSLLSDRLQLPQVDGIRCPTGSARLTGPGNYGTLKVSHVIHAVGPCYSDFDSFQEPDQLLSSAYKSSLGCALEAKLEAVAFSLLSAGVYRGRRSSHDVLQIGMQAIYDYMETVENDCLDNIFMCAFSAAEADTLLDIADEMGLQIVQ